MPTIVVLGACGGIGSMAARTVVAADVFDEVVLADLRSRDVQALADEIGDGRSSVRGAGVDATDQVAVAGLLSGSTHVLNCVGPFYRFGPPLLRAAIAAGTHYVDVCDDLDPTLTMLDLDADAKAHGVCALVGMGNSPGLANVLVRYCADQLLDAVDAVDIAHIHGGEPSEGPAVVKHRIHAMTNDVPVWEGSGLRTVRMLEPSGAAFVEEIDFRDVGRYPVFPYPHPETVTLPRHLPGVSRVTNRGVVFPLSYFTLTQAMVRTGTCVEAPVLVDGQPVVPLEFAVAHILSRRPALLEDEGIEGPAGCLRIDVLGRKDDERHRYVFSLSSRSAGAGEGTGIPAGLGAALMATGAITEPGVHPPEAVVDPLAMLGLAGTTLRRVSIGGASGGLPIHIEHHAPDGSVSELALAL